jgi:hypothetical protein
MPDQKLRDDIAALRAELEHGATRDPDLRARLRQLLDDLEQRLGGMDESQHRRLLDDLQDAVRQFEAEHPRATGILNEIMVTLSNMGI